MDKSCLYPLSQRYWPIRRTISSSLEGNGFGPRPFNFSATAAAFVSPCAPKNVDGGNAAFFEGIMPQTQFKNWVFVCTTNARKINEEGRSKLAVTTQLTIYVNSNALIKIEPV